MKNLRSFLKLMLCLLLIVTMASQSVLAEEIGYNIQFDEESGIQVIEVSETETLYRDSEGNEIKYNSEEGQFYYIYEGTEQLINITDVSEDGIVEWEVDSEELQLSGSINSMGAPEPQMAIAIGGTSFAISGILSLAMAFATKVVICGMVCYAAHVAAKAIKQKANSASYYPAYIVRHNVYVATGIGLSRATAIKRIKRGQNVWAKSAALAKSVCVAASPIRIAEYGKHGTPAQGQYPHYHAVKYYMKNGRYVHTGAHCWFY